MKYFYDHETDALSLVVTEFVGYAATEELAPNVVIYLDGKRNPLAVEIRNASKLVDTAGLIPMDERAITGEEVKARLDATEVGQRVLRSLGRQPGLGARP